jgi:hypothetical protein
MLEKSPNGRVKVALAGHTTSVCAVLSTLLDITAKGNATTNTVAPSTVARKQLGRATATSATTAIDLSLSHDLSQSFARPLLMLDRLIVVAHRIVNSFVFILILVLFWRSSMQIKVEKLLA